MEPSSTEVPTFPPASPLFPPDLVIIMLGTNDLKPVSHRTPMRIAIGPAYFIDLVNTLNGGVGTNYKIQKFCSSALRR